MKSGVAVTGDPDEVWDVMIGRIGEDPAAPVFVTTESIENVTLTDIVVVNGWLDDGSDGAGIQPAR